MGLTNKSNFGVQEKKGFTGLTFHQIETPESWGDETVNRSLYGRQVDMNFYNLKRVDIKDAYVDGNRIVLERWGENERIVLNIEELDNLKNMILSGQTEFEKLTKEVEDLSGKTEELYATKEEVAEAIEELEENISEEYVLAEDIDRYILSWASKNLKTINSISLIGNTNICLDTCGCHGGGQYDILPGKAISIESTEETKTVNVLADQGINETVASNYNSGKNFIEIKQDKTHSWLCVGGIDADSVYITENIKLGGTRLGDFAKADTFPEGFIPKGMNLQTLLEKLFYGERKEEWGNPSTDYILKIINNIIKITAKNVDTTQEINDGDLVPLGSRIKFEIKTPFSTEQKSNTKGFGYGYELDGVISSDLVYTKDDYDTTVECESGITYEGFTFENDIYTAAATENTINVFNSVSASTGYFDDIVLHDISSLGNISTTDTIVTMSGFKAVKDRKTASFRVRAFLPFYFNTLADIHDFKNSTQEENEAYILNNLLKSDKPIKDEKFSLTVNLGAKQFMLAFPKVSADKLDVRNQINMDIYKEDNVTEVNIFGFEYLVWSYEASVSAKKVYNYEITFIKD